MAKEIIWTSTSPEAAFRRRGRRRMNGWPRSLMVTTAVGGTKTSAVVQNSKSVGALNPDAFCVALAAVVYG